MARIAGVDLPPRKRAEIGLTYIYGIGRTRSNSILYRAGVDKDKKIQDLSEDEVNRIAPSSRKRARLRATSAGRSRSASSA